MGVSYRKSKKVGKNGRATVSKRGVSYSTGVKGARVSVNSRGKSRVNLSIPGTGFRYTKTLSAGSGAIMICLMGFINIMIWLCKIMVIATWWFLKFCFWCYYQLFLLIKRFVLWIIAKIKGEEPEGNVEECYEEIYDDESIIE